MRICQVLESTATGTLAMVRLIANSLSEMGHEVHVIYSIRNDTPENIESLFFPGVKLHHLQMNGSKLPYVIYKIRSIISEINPDVVHFHSSYAGFIGRLSFLFSNEKAKLFYSPHCISFMRRDISQIKKVFFILLERLATLKKCTYIACSKSEKITIEKLLPVKVRLIENAVIYKTTNISLKQNRNKNKFLIVTVGGIRKQKNPYLFSCIARKLKDRDDIDFVWIGDGNEKEKQQLVEANVIITGWLSSEEVYSYLQDADVYLSTSLWEGMPVSLIEAMYSHLPIIATGCPGNIDVISDKETGFIINENGDCADDLIERLIADNQLKKFISDNAYNDVTNRFSAIRYMNNLMKAYQEHL